MKVSRTEVMEEKNRLGSISISDDVIKVIAGKAAGNVHGVAQMSGSIADVLGFKNPGRGVKVEVNERQASISLHILVEYGVRIPDVAKAVQISVKKAVEEMTGLAVLNTSVNIEGVNF